MQHNSATFIVIGLIFALWYSNMYLKARSWPLHRLLLWIAGLIFGASVMVEPFASMMHHRFDYHMYGHLLLGMLSPLLLVLSRPVTLLLKTSSVNFSRKVSRLMQSRYVSFISHPVTALILNTGGLWVLYRTPLFSLMHESLLVYYLVHLHIFLAGYLFTSVILAFEPMMHRYSFKLRSIVLIVSIALHQILSKSFYPYPPVGVEKTDAEKGAMIMYYGGDVIELIIIYLLCRNWYYSVRPNKYLIIQRKPEDR